MNTESKPNLQQIAKIKCTEIDKIKINDVTENTEKQK